MNREAFLIFLAINLISSSYRSLSDNIIRYNKRKASDLSIDNNIRNEGNILVSDG